MSILDKLTPSSQRNFHMPKIPRKNRSNEIGPKRQTYYLSNGLTYNTNTNAVDVDSLRKQRLGRALILQTAAVQSAIMLISTTVADLICSTLRIETADGEMVEKPTTRQQAILDKFLYSANPFESGREMIVNALCDYLLTGNAVLCAEKSGGLVTNLYRMMPDTAKTSMNANNGPLRYTGQLYHWPTREDSTFVLERVCHVRYPNFMGTQRHDSRAGFVLGPVDTLKETLGIGGRIDQLINDFFNSNVRDLRIVFSTEHKVEEEAAEKFMEYIDELSENNDPIAFVQNGMQVHTVNPLVMDANMTSLRKEQIREVARVFRVPLFMLAEEKSGVQIETIARDVYSSCIKPNLNAFLSAMTHTFLNNRNETGGFKFSIDESELLRGNTAALVSLINAVKGDAQSNALMNSVEIRERIPGVQPKMKPDPNQAILKQGLKDRQSMQNEDSDSDEAEDKEDDE